MPGTPGQGSLGVNSTSLELDELMAQVPFTTGEILSKDKLAESRSRLNRMRTIKAGLEILPCGLFNMFNVTVTGNEIKKGKPHPEPFLKALRLLKVSSGQALVIENAPFGVEAAKRANLFCIALETSLPKKYLSRADFIFKSFAQLKEKIYFAK